MRSIGAARVTPLVAFAVVAAFAACGGGGGTLPATGSGMTFSSAPASYQGSVTPAQLLFPPVNFAPSPSPPQPATLSPTGFNGTLHVSVTAPQIVSVVPAGGTPGSFTVTPSSTGQTSIVFTDGVSATIVPVAVGYCVPPTAFLNGPVMQGLPPDRATGVSVNAGRVWFWQGNHIGPADPPFALRLVGSNGTVIGGSHLAVASPPPSVPAGVPPDAIWSAATVPALSAGTLYQVQLVSDIACLFQQAIGTFST